jgi:hypothetical protein
MKFSDIDFTCIVPDGNHTTGVPGLMLRVRGPSRVWVFRYTAIDGRRREMGLGSFVAANQTEADRALAATAMLAASAREQQQQGTDPIHSRKRLKDELRGARRSAKKLTLIRALRRFHELFVEGTSKPNAKRPGKSEKDWIRRCELYLPKWALDMPAAEFKAEHMAQAFDEMTCGNETKRKTRQAVRQCKVWVIDGCPTNAPRPNLAREETRAAWFGRYERQHRPSML